MLNKTESTFSMVHVNNLTFSKGSVLVIMPHIVSAIFYPEFQQSSIYCKFLNSFKSHTFHSILGQGTIDGPQQILNALYL